MTLECPATDIFNWDDQAIDESTQGERTLPDKGTAGNRNHSSRSKRPLTGSIYSGMSRITRHGFRNKGMSRDVSCDDATGPDDRVRANLHAGAEDRTAADLDGFARLLSAAKFGIHWMRCASYRSRIREGNVFSLFRDMDNLIVLLLIVFEFLSGAVGVSSHDERGCTPLRLLGSRGLASG